MRMRSDDWYDNQYHVPEKKDKILMYAILAFFAAAIILCALYFEPLTPQP